MLINLLVLAGISFAQSDSCAIYPRLAMEMSCTRENYLTNFGEKYCRIFVEKEEREELSESSIRVFQKIRPCLQDLLEKEEGLTCENVEDHAARHHVQCYVDSGYCELNLGDKLSILAIVWKETSRKNFRKAMRDIHHQCSER